MNNSTIEQCISIFKKDDFKKYIKIAISPVIDIILSQIYPYIYISLFLVIISFLLHLGIFILLLRSRILFPSQ